MYRKAEGFSLVELLVCVAIVGILMAMYLPALSKARKQAESVVVKEGFRQENIGKMTGQVAAAGRAGETPSDPSGLRASARAAFRCTLAMTGRETIATYLLWRVSNENEFKAYWHTLINPENTTPIEMRNGGLVAKDETGAEYVLGALDNFPGSGSTVPVGWEFLSSTPAESTAGTRGTNVIYSDTHVSYVPYPTGYPACKTVAELSHRFMAGRA